MALRALRVGVLDQSRVISGHTPGQVREQLLALVEQYAPTN